MNNTKITLRHLLVVICSFQIGLHAQQMEVAHDASGSSPHIELTQTVDNKSSRIFFNNSSNNGSKWAINAHNGSVIDTEIGIYYNGFYRFQYDEADKEFRARGNMALHSFADESFSNFDFVLSSNPTGTTSGAHINWKDDQSTVASIQGVTNTGIVPYKGMRLFAGDNAEVQIAIKEDQIEISDDETDLDAYADRFIVHHDSDATSTNVKLVENNTTDFARIGFENEGSDNFFNISARPGHSTDPRLQVAYNGDPILIVDGDNEMVGINDATPDYTFAVNHDTGQPSETNDNGLSIQNNDNGNQWIMYSFVSGDKLGLFFKDDLGVLTHVGNFMTDGTYVSASDSRLKSNISGLHNQLEKLLLLRPKQYNLNSSPNSRNFGLIAQEVQKIFPDVVTNLDNVEEGGKGYLGVGYTELIPVIIAGMQEQQELIKNQQKEMDAMKEELESLKYINRK